MEIYFMVAIIYFIMSFVAARIVRQIEHALTPRYLRAGRKAMRQPVGRLDVTPA
jgi:hypothetical protein